MQIVYVVHHLLQIVLPLQNLVSTCKSPKLTQACGNVECKVLPTVYKCVSEVAPKYISINSVYMEVNVYIPGTTVKSSRK